MNWSSMGKPTRVSPRYVVLHLGPVLVFSIRGGVVEWYPQLTGGLGQRSGVNQKGGGAGPATSFLRFKSTTLQELHILITVIV